MLRVCSPLSPRIPLFPRIPFPHPPSPSLLRSLFILAPLPVVPPALISARVKNRSYHGHRRYFEKLKPSERAKPARRETSSGELAPRRAALAISRVSWSRLVAPSHTFDISAVDPPAARTVAFPVARSVYFSKYSMYPAKNEKGETRTDWDIFEYVINIWDMFNVYMIIYIIIKLWINII